MGHLLHDLLETSAEQYPHAVAVSDRNGSLTYAELDRRANQIANALLTLGVARGDRVGLYLEKSVDAVAGIHGILKAGAAYVPLDPSAPPARLAYILSNCDVRVLLTGQEKASTWGELITDESPVSEVVVLNGHADTHGMKSSVRWHDQESVATSSPEHPRLPMVDLDLAYILYTSGSTGQPKGVMLTHLNALSFVNWAVKEFGVTPEDRLSSHAPFHFDLSIFDLFAAAKAGARVIIVPPKTSVFPTQVTKFMAENEITIWYSVPSILSMLVLRGKVSAERLPKLRTILFAGEVFPTKYLRSLVELLPNVRFCNLYGPTETNVCTWYEVTTLTEDDDTTIPIGRAIDNVEAIIVDDHNNRVAAGEVGELLVRGTTVMQGYWADPERTKRGLVPNPWGIGPTDMLYRTGDLVQELPDGNLRFLGRRDSQVKSRGYRIELGDVEAAINAHADVVECAVIAIPDPLVSNRLHASLVTRNGLGRDGLSAHCASRLPVWMIPEEFDFRESLPKTSTGKIDRQALRAAAEAATDQTPGQPSG